ncbi:MAG: 50S ribosomal protein L24 [Candidatus Gracilibacteria bacterium]|nr:50S ribosomal protein L24 [Candidatus Gracilibacteria bacterium]
MKIRKDDNVLVISGKDKGKTGKVLKVLARTNKVLIEGINVVTRNYKKNGTTPGQSVKKENPLDVSNVMLVCPFTSKPTRVGFVFIEDKSGSKKFRFSKAGLKAKGGEAKDYIIK